MILSMDLGSTNFKAALFDDTLTRRGEYSLPSPYINNDGDCVEMDASVVQRVIVKLISEACQNADMGTDSISSVAVGSQAQNFTIMDMRGDAKCPVISWLDKRSEAEAQELWGVLGNDWHKHCSFHELNGSMQLSHLLWLKHNMPDVLQGEFNLVTLPGLVFMVLSGINLTDENLAAMTGIYSLLDKDWRAEELAKCGVSVGSMPQRVKVGVPVTVKSNCESLDLRKEIFLVSAGNDQTAGAFGNGCKENDILATLGTALVAYRRTGNKPGPYSKTGCWGPYPGGGYYELAVNNNGCQALDWAREVLMPDVGIKEFDAAVARAIPMITEKTGTFHPSSMRTDAAWQGEFSNIDEKAYAVVEGITFDLYKLIFDDLVAPAGSLLRVVGGGSHSELWLQLIADVLNCPVSAGSGDSLLGAAAMAAGCEVKPVESKVFQSDSLRHKLLSARRCG